MLAPGPMTADGWIAARGSMPSGGGSHNPLARVPRRKRSTMAMNATRGSATRMTVRPLVGRSSGTTTAVARQAGRCRACLSFSTKVMWPAPASVRERASLISASPSPDRWPWTSSANSRTVAVTRHPLFPEMEPLRRGDGAVPALVVRIITPHACADNASFPVRLHALLQTGHCHFIRRSALSLFSVLLEPLEPRQHERVLDLLRAPQVLETVPPVEPDPAARSVLRAVDEPVELGERALQRERLLNDHRAADREPRQRLQRVVHLSPFGIDVDAEKIQVGGDLLGNEPGAQARSVQAPVHQADGNQVFAVLFPDRRSELLNPLPGDGGARAVALIQGDELNEVLARERRPQPRHRLAVAAGHDRRVHQVIAKDGRT